MKCEPTSTFFPALAASLSRPGGTGSKPSASPKSTPTAAASSPSTGPPCPTSETCELFTPSNVTYSPGGHLVSLRLVPGSAEARRMTVGSGRRLLPLLTAAAQPGACLRTLLASCLSALVWNSSVCLLRWRASVTPFNRLLFQLVPSMPRTEGTECGLWPTPQEHNAQGAPGKSCQANGGHRSDLVSKVKLWPTPRNNTGPSKDAHHLSLDGSVNGSLNPTWVEWLQGFPAGWTACEGSAMPSSGKSRRKSSAASSKRKGA